MGAGIAGLSAIISPLVEHGGGWIVRGSGPPAYRWLWTSWIWFVGAGKWTISKDVVSVWLQN
jgi:hypothetical protein